MKDILKKDLYRYIGDENNCFFKQLRYILFTPGYQYTYCFRKISLSKNPISKLFWKIMLRRCMFHTSIQIPVGTEIGAGLRIMHFGPIVVNPEAKIGRNFSIAQNTLIGNAAGKNKGAPVIGDNVYMAANSVVIGGVTIGDRVMIAPGAMINFDVPSDSIVIGNPGRIIPSNRPTDKYIVYSV